jgi:hypothetical protein
LVNWLPAIEDFEPLKGAAPLWTSGDVPPALLIRADDLSDEQVIGTSLFLDAPECHRYHRCYSLKLRGVWSWTELTLAEQ